MLGRKRRVELDEGERSVRSDEELERARIAVADVQARALRGGLHLLAKLRVERRRGRLLDQLLVPPLDRALPLAARQYAAVRVAHDLDLDVPRRGDRLLDVERAVPERRVGLGRRVGVRSVDLRGPADDPHAASAAAGGRFEQYRVA